MTCDGRELSTYPLITLYDPNFDYQHIVKDSEPINEKTKRILIKNILGGWNSGNMNIVNNSPGDKIFLKATNSSTVQKSLLTLNPDVNEGGVSLLDSSILFTRIVDATFFDNCLGNLHIRNLVHGGRIFASCETAGGVSKTLLTFEPNEQTVSFGKSISFTSENVVISGGVITQTGTSLLIDTESAAPSDELNTITATGPYGTIIICSPINTNHTVIFKDNVGNLRLAGDFTADSNHDTITLFFKLPNWIELSRSNNS